MDAEAIFRVCSLNDFSLFTNLSSPELCRNDFLLFTNFSSPELCSASTLMQTEVIRKELIGSKSSSTALSGRVDFNLNMDLKCYSSVSYGKQINGRVTYGSRRDTTVRASSSESVGSPAPITPLRLESLIGQFLSQILIDHLHLVLAAVEHQLEQLQTDREAETQKEEPPVSVSFCPIMNKISSSSCAICDNSNRASICTVCVNYRCLHFWLIF